METNTPHTPNNPEHMKEAILAKIRTGEVSMRPKLYFTFQLLALVALCVAILGLSVFILNFILFSIRVNSHDSLLGFGTRGLFLFLMLFPWKTLLLDVLLVAIANRLIRKFRFGYKTPTLYLFLGVLAVIVLGAVGIDRGTDVNDRLLHHADRHELPFGDDFFEGARRPLPGSGVCKCVITAIVGNTLTVADTRNGTTTSLTVVLPPGGPDATSSMYHVGDTVFVAGDEDDGVIRAFGVRQEPPSVR